MKTASPKSRVNSATRALAVIEYLNRHNSAPMRDIVAALTLSRGTVYRLLQTLCDAGYLRRDEANGTYALGERVRSLADGYARERWIVEFAQDRLDSLCLSIKWPLKLLTRSDIDMVVRHSTDLLSPYTRAPTFAGFRQPLFQSPSGRLYLALCPPQQRRLLIDLIAREAPKTLPKDMPSLAGLFRRMKVQGFECDLGPSISTIAVPVFSSTQVFGCLSMQYYTSALTYTDIVQNFVPRLTKVADAITADLRRRPGYIV
jgi:IclR family mhp operon transcriptional activator